MIRAAPGWFRTQQRRAARPSRRAFVLLGVAATLILSYLVWDMGLGRRLLMSGTGGAFTPPVPEQGRWSARTVILEPDVAWEGLGILEPSPVVVGTNLRIYYRGGGLHGPDTAVGFATAPLASDLTDPASYTKYASNPIYGNGVIEALDIICPNVVYVDTTYILYYSTGTLLRAATSLDGITFATWGYDLIALPSGAIYFGNTTVWREGGSSWYMFFDAYLPGPDYWASYFATSSDGQTWTIGNGGAEMSTLQITANGTYGSLHVVPSDPKLGGTDYQAWYHASSSSDNTFSDIFRAHSANKTTWTQVNPQPILTHSGTGYETQQIADPHPIEIAGTSYLFIDADDNITDIAAIEVVKFNGTLAQLVEGN